MRVTKLHGPNPQKITNSAGHVSVRVRRCCPYCGKAIYEKLGNCNGTIFIKCPRCGKRITMNLALRTVST